MKKKSNVDKIKKSFGGFIAGNYCIHIKTGIKQVILIEPAGLLPFFSKYGAPLALSLIHI